MAASKDYRDGAAFGASELRRRIEMAASLGLTVTDASVNEMAAAMISEMGGHPDLGRRVDSESHSSGVTS